LKQHCDLALSAGTLPKQAMTLTQKKIPSQGAAVRRRASVAGRPAEMTDEGCGDLRW
jgi:hypothetical protein